MLTGKICSLVPDRCFGFIRADGVDYFFKYGDVKGKQKYIYRGNVVTFDFKETGMKCPEAYNIVPEPVAKTITWHNDAMPPSRGWYWGLMSDTDTSAYPVYYDRERKEWTTIDNSTGEFVYAYPVMWGKMKFQQRDE